MEIKDLRIWNIIYSPIQKESVTLVAIEQGNRPIVKGSKGTSSFSGFDCLQGVQLTEDILLKCPQFENDYQLSFKFKSIRIEYLFEKWNLRFIISETESLFVKEIEFLHDLQNVTYALTNEELNIQL